MDIEYFVTSVKILIKHFTHLLFESRHILYIYLTMEINNIHLATVQFTLNVVHRCTFQPRSLGTLVLMINYDIQAAKKVSK